MGVSAMNIFERPFSGPVRIEIENLCAVTVEGNNRTVGKIIHDTEIICRGDRVSRQIPFPYELLEVNADNSVAKISVKFAEEKKTSIIPPKKPMGLLEKIGTAVVLLVFGAVFSSIGLFILLWFYFGLREMATWWQH